MNAISSRSILLLSCVTSFSQVFAGLDLTPATRQYTEDGITYRVVSFRNGEDVVQFYPPDGWMVRGQQSRLQLTPPQKDLSEAVVEVTPLIAPQPLDEAVVAAFKQKVLAGLPPGSSKVTIVSEAPNTLTPGGKPSFEVVVSYRFWGKNLQRSALLVNGPQQHLVFRFTSMKDDFAVLQTAFRRSVASWQWIDKASPVVAQMPVAAAK